MKITKKNKHLLLCVNHFQDFYMEREKYQKIWTVINTQQKLFKGEKLYNF